jgi:AraC-like DNA-binding protein
MRILEPSADLIDAPQQHAEHVYFIAHGGTPAPGLDEVSTSWLRCVNQYGVDPVTTEAPRILTAHEFKEFRQPLEQLVASAQDEIDRLYNLVRAAGYSLLFCDSKGVAIEHRGNDADATLYKYWGIWLGAVWSEATEGTNGIGTCIAERRPVTVHRSQHFRSRHIGLSCSGAPVFGPDGSLMAVLDVSSIDAELSERAHALTGPLTATAARAIEERFFRESFRRRWIVAVSVPEAGVPGMLLAVDGSQRIVGANRAARMQLLLDTDRLQSGVGLWSLFERDHSLFRSRASGDISTVLVIAGGAEKWAALVTPPEMTSGAWSGGTSGAPHTRPRLDLVGMVRDISPAPPVHGGLSSGAMRRVQEYVEANLAKNVDLADLAAIAGLSVFHFAREFKRSMGITPHLYLVQKRVERAQDMLARSDLTLAEIAIATGFSDQSHLARQFRQMLGTSPGEFRRSLR